MSRNKMNRNITPVNCYIQSTLSHTQMSRNTTPITFFSKLVLIMSANTTQHILTTAITTTGTYWRLQSQPHAHTDECNHNHRHILTSAITTTCTESWFYWRVQSPPLAQSLCSTDECNHSHMHRVLVLLTIIYSWFFWPQMLQHRTHDRLQGGYVPALSCRE